MPRDASRNWVAASFTVGKIFGIILGSPLGPQICFKERHGDMQGWPRFGSPKAWLGGKKKLRWGSGSVAKRSKTPFWEWAFAAKVWVSRGLVGHKCIGKTF